MTTRAQLASDLNTWVGRDDVGVSPLFDTIIRMAEAKINRKLRVREREQVLELALSQQSTDLPADFVRVRSLTSDNDEDRSLIYYPPEALRKSPAWVNRGVYSGGQIHAYTIEGNQLTVAPAPTQDEPLNVTLVFHAVYAPLVNAGDTNWLLQNYYDIYMFAVLIQAHLHLEESDYIDKYEQKFHAAANELMMQENRARIPGGTALRSIGSPRRVV